MNNLKFWPVTGLAVCLLLIPASLHSKAVDQKASPALTGTVTSADGADMEGVLVTARRDDANFTVTVVSDNNGHYAFPRGRLAPGSYSLSIRAIGYDLASPSSVRLDSKKSAMLDLKLEKTKDLSAQLSSAEWLDSFPGTYEQKVFLLGCTACHTLQRVAKSHHTADEWLEVFQRMSTYYPEDSTTRPEKAKPGGGVRPGDNERLRKQAEYMSTINLSSSDHWSYPLKTFPRPTGRATRVIITEYDLPRKDSIPHDVVVDQKGEVWFSDAGWMILGKLDPNTTKVKEFPLPVFKSDDPIGLVDLELDKKGNLWPGLNEQAIIAEFDPQTEKFKFWDFRKDGVERSSFLMPYHDDVDGKVWTTDLAGVQRLDLATGQIEKFNVFQNVPGGPRGHLVYQVTADSQNNCYFLDWPSGGVGRVDAKTGEISYYPTPTRGSFSRRGHLDSSDRLWFDEYNANRIAMFDPATKTIKEWEVPQPWTAPYDVAPDQNGEVWSTGNTSDRIQRFDPKTGQFIEYLLPRYSDVRRISFDENAKSTTMWLPNKNVGSVIKVEPLD